jgi:hypothetical protein
MPVLLNLSLTSVRVYGHAQIQAPDFVQELSSGFLIGGQKRTSTSFRKEESVEQTRSRSAARSEGARSRTFPGTFRVFECFFHQKLTLASTFPNYVHVR